jgi:phage terminase large subunit-like protein
MSARLRRQQPWCSRCGSPHDLTLDHLDPVALVGTAVPSIDRLAAPVTARRVTDRWLSWPPATQAGEQSPPASTPRPGEGPLRIRVLTPREGDQTLSQLPSVVAIVSSSLSVTDRLDPRRRVDLSPLGWKLPARGPKRAAAFMGRLTVPRGHGALKPMVLESWQLDVLDGLLGEPRPRTGVVCIGRGNGKTGFAVALGLYLALADGTPGAQVLIVSATERQAVECIRYATKMVERSPDLAARCKALDDRLRFPFVDGDLIALPASAAALIGFDPSALIIDEIGACADVVWEAATTAIGKRPTSTTLAIGSPVPWGGELLPRLLDVAETEPTMRAWRWTAPTDAPVGDEATWRLANPAYGTLIAPDGMRSAFATTREAEFRSYRLAQFGSESGGWCDVEAWAGCGADRRLVDGDSVALAFDGSYSGDASALLACTLDGHLAVLGHWANEGAPGWRVPRDEVDDAVAAAFDRYRVEVMLCDPWGWPGELAEWRRRWGETVVLDFPTNSIRRFGPACTRFLTGVHEATISHARDPRLTRNIAAAKAKETPFGPIPVKRTDSKRIDLCVAAVLAHEGVDLVAQRPAIPRRRAYSF